MKKIVKKKSLVLTKKQKKKKQWKLNKEKDGKTIQYKK